MRTARVLTVSPSMYCVGGGGCLLPGGVPCPRGVSGARGCLFLGGVPGPGGMRVSALGGVYLVWWGAYLVGGGVYLVKGGCLLPGVYLVLGGGGYLVRGVSALGDVPGPGGGQGCLLQWGSPGLGSWWGVCSRS